MSPDKEIILLQPTSQETGCAVFETSLRDYRDDGVKIMTCFQ
jgi:hypothetical protein